MQTKVNQDNIRAERQALKKQLGNGDMQKIASLSGVALNTVWRYFENKSDNADVKKAYDALIAKKNEELQIRINNLK